MRKDFRIAFLNKMGFRGGAQLKTSLEAIFEHRVIDITKLKKICHLFEIPSQYRIRVWKILLDVMPPYQEAWDLVQEQRAIEYNDLRSAVSVVKKSNSFIPLETFYIQWKDTIKKYSIDSDEDVVFRAKDLAATCLALIYHTKEQYFNFQNGLYYLGDEGSDNMPSLQQPKYNPPTFSSSNNSSHGSGKYNSSAGTRSMSYDMKQQTPTSANSQYFQQKQQQQQQRQQQQQHIISSDNNNNNNTSIQKLMEYNSNNNEHSKNIPLLDLQIDESLKSIAEAFCYIFDNEIDAFWCLNNFLNISVKQYGNKDIGLIHQINILSRLLEIHDKVIFNHFKSLNIHVDQFCTLWFKSFFTCFVPPNSIDRVWDRIIGVSMDFMAYLSFSILQSKKAIILEKSTSIELLQYLINFKDINLDIVLERSIELYSSTSDL
ncbi:hypothetical protein CYY_006752 [Polysphondylium violaceum]|uniref:TBC1 domain family member 7 n=1 Tax=Polysphondylium violaceum TaxID=133409 RepID=A0A8J4PQ18_9MYCE|nr:hypothetical protein CYY_006752 [Polysphondylium violaceum]